MKKIVYCPYCKQETSYIVKKRKVDYFKGIKVDTYENVGVCIKCNQDLFINELEEENNKRLWNKYKEITNTITPEEIVSLREKYNISQRELTSILGFGKMTINRYEKGKIPTKSKSDYLHALIDNDCLFLKEVDEAYTSSRITQKTYTKIMNSQSQEKSIETLFNNSLRDYITYFLHDDPTINNGYHEFDLIKLENIISYIAHKNKGITINDLCNYLWIIDNTFFSHYGVSVTGLTYQKSKYGTTIISNMMELICVLGEKYKKEYYEDNSYVQTKICSLNNYDLSVISKDELDIINRVLSDLKGKKFAEILTIIKENKTWRKTLDNNTIPFEIE